jgi:hypothetical protein
VTVLLVLGIGLFLGGQALLASSFLHRVDPTTATIPAGAWFHVFEVQVLGGARIEGQFQDLEGRGVQVLVLAQEAYETYALTGVAEGLYSIEGISGRFLATLPASGTYYLVFAHAMGSEFADQEILVSFRILGVQADFLAAGLLLIVPGIGSTGIGLRARRARGSG